MSSKTMAKLTLLALGLTLFIMSGGLEPDGGCPPRADGKPITSIRRCM